MPSRLWAIIVAGGRTTRLDRNCKAALVGGDGRNLLERVVDSCSGAQRIVVVGPVATNRALLGNSCGGNLTFTQEDPPLSGPACAIVAGVEALQGFNPETSDPVVVLGGDLPEAASAVEHLLAAQGQPDGGRGVVAVDPSGQRQWLLAVLRWDSLAQACAAMAKNRGGSVRQLLTPLIDTEVTLDWSQCADIDTWEQAQQWGFSQPNNSGKETK